MKIVGGYSQIGGNYTVYHVIHKDIVYAMEASTDPWDIKTDGYYLHGKWSTISRYHKDNSSNSIPVTPEQIITKKFPDDGYTGQSLSYLNVAVLSSELRELFIQEFKNLKAYERDKVIERILEEKYVCDNCDNECLESELLEDDYAQYKGFSEELFCPNCKAIVE